MDLLAWPWFLLLSGLVVGAIAGFAARYARFCTLDAIERWTYAHDFNGMRSWLLAALTALVLTQIMIFTGLVDLSSSFYLAPAFGLTGAVAGGLMFGYGMALTGTCGFGALVRVGGGSLKSLVALIVLAIFALVAQKGLLSIVRIVTVDNLAIGMGSSQTQSLGDIASVMGGHDLRMLVAIIFALALAIPVARGEWRRCRQRLIAGGVVGACIAAGWLITSQAAQYAFDPVQLEAGSFVVPVGDTLMQVVAYTGTVPDYGVGLVIGVVIGAAICATIRRDIRWEACDDARELSRHIVGAALMGIGGVFAMGCTIGQGVSAMSLMAISAPVVFVSIIIGARMGLAYLLEGSSFAAFHRSNGAPAE